VSSDAAIAAEELTKVFGHQRAVDGLSLTVPRGSVYGFLGPNGSGKTTTIRMLLGLIAATSGTASLLGEPMPRGLHAVLPRVGALIESPAIYPFLSGRANLSRLDSADARSDARTRRARVAAALDRVGLSHAAGKKAGAYSLGMKQRLGLANALLRERELLVLDEPTNGLDPQGTREVRGLIRSLAADGTTVFVSSHLLSEIEQMCSHVAVMRAGRLVAEGTLDELRAGSTRQLTLTTPDPEAARRVLAERGVELAATQAGAARPDAPVGAADAAATVTAELPADLAVEDLTAALVAAGVRVRAIAASVPSLEDRFVALTGEGFDVAG
jgi:ABC-2 type transport system ATP-binding protein